MIKKDYPWHMWAMRLESAGYEPTPLGFEKLLSDFDEAKRLDRELQSKGLGRWEIDDLRRIKDALPAAPADELMEFAGMLNLLYNSRITLPELREFIELQKFCRGKGIHLTAASFERLLESRESLKRGKSSMAEVAILALEIIDEAGIGRKV